MCKESASLMELVGKTAESGEKSDLISLIVGELALEERTNLEGVAILKGGMTNSGRSGIDGATSLCHEASGDEECFAKGETSYIGVGEGDGVGLIGGGRNGGRSRLESDLIGLVASTLRGSGADICIGGNTRHLGKLSNNILVATSSTTSTDLVSGPFHAGHERAHSRR